VNDETTLRIYGSKSDAYAAFKSMFDKGDPPDDSFALLQAASADLDNAADQTAVETVTVPERTALQPADHEAFFAVLDRPPVPTEKLREALARHRKTTINR
jgi:uncharacterized protein (DUF1778 family)